MAFLGERAEHFHEHAFPGNVSEANEDNEGAGGA